MSFCMGNSNTASKILALNADDITAHCIYMLTMYLHTYVQCYVYKVATYEDM